MCACRRRRASLQPDFWVNLDMWKSRRYLSQMGVKCIISAFVVPGRCDLSGRVAENRTELVFNSHGVGKSTSDCVKACLRCVCPDTQDIREIPNFNHAHLVPSRGRCDCGFTEPDQCLANISWQQRNRSFCLGSPSAAALYDLGRTISRQSICRPSLHGGRSPDRSLHIGSRVFRRR